jgi:hypothetical protein
MQIGGTLTVSTANVTRGAPRHPEHPPAGDYVEICVADTGSGMSPEVREKAFEPFFTTKEVGKGSGLGLSQILGFAKQSGGGVSIDSRPGEGTSDLHLCAARERVPERQPLGDPRVDARALTGARILLVDDDNAVREVTAEALRELGYKVAEAGSGGAALDLLERIQVDLMIVDFAMPGMSGAEARETRARQAIRLCRSCSSPVLRIAPCWPASARRTSSASRSRLANSPTRRALR